MVDSTQTFGVSGSVALGSAGALFVTESAGLADAPAPSRTFPVIDQSPHVS